MASASFDDKPNKPDDASLFETLGKTKKHWDSILDHVGKECAGVQPEWKYYGAKHGWQLKLTHKKRAVLYMIPHQGSFLASMALGENAVAALPASGLPPSFVREIENAKAFPEGRPARIEVTGKEQADIVKKLLAVKLGG